MDRIFCPVVCDFLQFDISDHDSCRVSNACPWEDQLIPSFFALKVKGRGLECAGDIENSKDRHIIPMDWQAHAVHVWACFWNPIKPQLKLHPPSQFKLLVILLVVLYGVDVNELPSAGDSFEFGAGLAAALLQTGVNDLHVLSLGGPPIDR